MLIHPLSAFSLLAAAALAQTAAAAPATVRLEGRVTDLRGEPVPAADVWAAPRNERDSEVVRTKCDGDGCFVMHVPTRPPWIVRATASGRSIGERAVAGSDVPIVLAVHDAATVRGIMHDRAGGPVAGAVVAMCQLLRRPRGPDAVARDEAITAADGSFSLVKVPLGPVVVVACVPGEGMVRADLVVRGDATCELTPVAEHATTIEVIATGLSADGRREARIELIPGDYLYLPAPWQLPRLDMHGAFRFEQVPDAHYVVRVFAPGIRFDPHERRLQQGKGPHRVEFAEVPRSGPGLVWTGARRDLGDLVLEKPAAVEGLVRGAAGRPLPGARVTLHEGALARFFTHGGDGSKETVTDRQGRYRFAGAPPGEAQLQFVGETEDEYDLRELEVRSGATTSVDLAANR